MDVNVCCAECVSWPSKPFYIVVIVYTYLLTFKYLHTEKSQLFYVEHHLLSVFSVSIITSFHYKLCALFCAI